MFVDTLDIDFFAASATASIVTRDGEALRLEDILVDAPVAGGLPSALSFAAIMPRVALAELPALDPTAGILPL